MRATSLLACFTLAALASACSDDGGSAKRGLGGGNDGGCDGATCACDDDGSCDSSPRCKEDADCTGGKQCMDGTCAPANSCGAKAFGSTVIPPNVLLVLDRSCSMKDKLSDQGPTKWSSAVSAIGDLTDSFTKAVRFGLVLFPDSAARNKPALQCESAGFPVPVGDAGGAATKSVLTAALKAGSANFPDGPCVTNIDSALWRASTEKALFEAGRNSYVMLITDGKQARCSAHGGDAGAVDILSSLAKKGVRTYVVGFQSKSADQAQLSSFARAGGTARAGKVAFYDATDSAALRRSLAEIVSSVASCEYALDETPPDPTKLYVYVNETTQVARDDSHKQGWGYDAKRNTITFYGQACEKLRDGTSRNVNVVYGCPSPVVQ